MKFSGRIISVLPLLVVAFFNPSPAQAIAPGCYQGQVGLYAQPSYQGHCFGFVSDNRDLLFYDEIARDFESMWNGGTSGQAAKVFYWRDFSGTYKCADLGDRHSFPRRNAFSNHWWHASC